MVNTRNNGMFPKGFYSKFFKMTRPETTNLEINGQRKRKSISHIKSASELDFLKRQIRHIIVKFLKPKRKEVPMISFRINISNQLAAFLTEVYEISKRYCSNQNFNNSLDLISQRYLSTNNLIRIIDDSIEFKLTKKSDSIFLDSNQKKQRVKGFFVLACRFKKEEVVIDN